MYVIASLICSHLSRWVHRWQHMHMGHSEAQIPELYKNGAFRNKEHINKGEWREVENIYGGK